MKIKKGDIFLLENISAEGHQQKGNRPHVIVTQVVAGMVTVAPCTSSKSAAKFLFTVELDPNKSNKLDKKSFHMKQIACFSV